MNKKISNAVWLPYFDMPDMVWKFHTEFYFHQSDCTVVPDSYTLSWKQSISKTKLVQISIDTQTYVFF